MPFAYPSQRLQDWLSQQWCIASGQRLDLQQHAWLDGPFGYVDSIGDQFLSVLAQAEGLAVRRGVNEGGLLDAIDDLSLSARALSMLDPAVIAFYENTSRYCLDLRFRWNPFFASGAWLVNFLYGNRLKQLNFPLHNQEFSDGIHSEIITLNDALTNTVRYRIWYRTVQATGRVLYAGIYTTCRLPSGRVCVKVIFPLPRGNATVIMAPRLHQDGSLELISAGNGFGDPGFYFLLNDARGQPWVHYIRSFREYLRVRAVDDHIRAVHTLSLWRQQVAEIHYAMRQETTWNEN